MFFFLYIFYQFFLLFSSQLLNLPFSSHCLFLCLKLLIIHQFYGKSCPGIFCPFSRIMTGHPLVQICSPSCIKASIPALQHISIIFHVLTPAVLCSGRSTCFKSQSKRPIYQAADKYVLHSAGNPYGTILFERHLISGKLVQRL